MSVVELSYLYDIIQGIEVTYVVIFTIFMAYIAFLIIHYYEIQYDNDEEVEIVKSKIIKNAKIFAIMLIVLIIIPSPRTIILSQTENLKLPQNIVLKIMDK